MGACCSAGPTRRKDDDAEVVHVDVDRIDADGKTLQRVNQYQIEKQLGKGAFGAVYRAVDDTRNQVVAIKVMDKAELKKKTRMLGKPPLPKPGLTKPGMKPGLKAGSSKDNAMPDTILKEIAVMKRLQHPNCVNLYEVIDDPLGDRIFLVMELLLGGEVMANENLPPGQQYQDEHTARCICRDLLDGLECTSFRYGAPRAHSAHSTAPHPSPNQSSNNAHTTCSPLWHTSHQQPPLILPSPTPRSPW